MVDSVPLNNRGWNDGGWVAGLRTLEQLFPGDSVCADEPFLGSREVGWDAVEVRLDDRNCAS